MHGRQQVEAQAREWLAYLYSGEATSEGEQRFASWLNESGTHAAAYARCEQMWRDVGGAQGRVAVRGAHLTLALMPAASQRADALSSRDPPDAGHDGDASDEPASRTGRNARDSRDGRSAVPHRWRSGGWRWAARAASVLFVAVALVWWVSAQRVTETRFYSDAAGLKTISLSDGSQITLGASSAVVVRMSRRSRHVNLAAGRAFFAVAHGDSRPFTVAAGVAEARVTGTQFEVRRQQGDVQVAVAEGSVEVSTEAPSPPQRYVIRLRAGDGVSADAGGRLSPVRHIDLGTGFAWRTGRFVYVDTPLEEVLRDVNPFRTSPITLASPDLGAIRVTASFRTDQTDRLLTALATTQPLTIERTGNRVVLRPAPAPRTRPSATLN